MVCAWCLLPILHFYSSSYFLHKARKKVGRLLTAESLAKPALTCATTTTRCRVKRHLQTIRSHEHASPAETKPTQRFVSREKSGLHPSRLQTLFKSYGNLGIESFGQNLGPALITICLNVSLQILFCTAIGVIVSF